MSDMALGSGVLVVTAQYCSEWVHADSSRGPQRPSPRRALVLVDLCYCMLLLWLFSSAHCLAMLSMLLPVRSLARACLVRCLHAFLIWVAATLDLLVSWLVLIHVLRVVHSSQVAAKHRKGRPVHGVRIVMPQLGRG